MASPPNPFGPDDGFDGDHAKDHSVADIIGTFLRTESVHVENDPRVMSDSVIYHRLNNFTSVVIASMLLTTLAFQPLTVLKPEKFDMSGVITTLALLMYLGCMIANLFCTVVIIQQAYLINRLATSGSLGFEMAKSLYLTKNFTALRHVAIWFFFMSIPMFIMATALMVWEVLVRKQGAVVIGGAITIVMIILALVIHRVHAKQRAIFHEKLTQMSFYEQPMRQHMEAQSKWRSFTHIAKE
jgi:hypothetical protein